VKIMNLVTPKAGAKHELLFNEPASGACQHRKFLGNYWILHEQLINLKEFFLKLC
jgi:hypothetical protein